jgi:hypothetical protein
MLFLIIMASVFGLIALLTGFIILCGGDEAVFVFVVALAIAIVCGVGAHHVDKAHEEAAAEVALYTYDIGK